MQKPFEGISLYLLLVMSDSEQHDIPRDSQSTTPPEHEDSLSNAETLRLFSQRLDSKLDQKFTSFKRELEEKDNLTQSQLKKLKTETKASNTFNYKGNRVQFEFNLNVLDQIETASKNLRAGKVSSATSDLEEAKKLIDKRNKLVRFADKSPAGWTAVEEYESDELADDSEDEKKLRSAEKRALSKIREKKRKFQPARPRAPQRESATETQTSFSAAPAQHSFNLQQPFRHQSFRARQPVPADKCFSCGQRGHWANSSVCPSRNNLTRNPPSTKPANG